MVCESAVLCGGKVLQSFFLKQVFLRLGVSNLAPNGAGLCCPPVLRPRQVVSKALLGAELFYEDH